MQEAGDSFGAVWAKTVRLLQRPESLTFLDRIQRQLGELSIPDDLKQDAIRFEGLRRRPAMLQGEAPQSQASRGWWLIATVRYRRDPAFCEAVASVRGVLLAVAIVCSIVCSLVVLPALVVVSRRLGRAL